MNSTDNVAKKDIYPGNPEVWYFVIRTHSHTNQQQLIKVVSRPMKTWIDAGTWKRTCEMGEKNKDHRYAVIAVPDNQEVLFCPAECDGEFKDPE